MHPTSSNNNTKMYWAMNKFTIDTFAWDVSSSGSAHCHGVTDMYAIRPVITIRTNLPIISGNGTWKNPYQI